MEVDKAFTELFKVAREDKDTVLVAGCVTEGEDNDHIRMSMHGSADSVLAIICMMIKRHSEQTGDTVTGTLLRIANAMTEE